MKGACSIPKKKLIQLFIIIPIAALALLYGSGYLSQLFSNYHAWQEAGAVFGTSPAFPDAGFFPCLAAAFHFPYGLYGLGLCIGALALLILMVMRMGYSEGGEYDRRRNLVYSNKGTYGTAGFMSRKELTEVLDLVPDIRKHSGTILGELDHQVICIPPKTRFNGNLAVYGASGSKKTRAFCVNMILQCAARKSSLVICDPKSELYEKTSEYLRDQGYTVRVFNLVTPSASDSWNCLAEVGGQELMAQLFCDVIIKNTGGEERDHFWDSAEMNLLKALVLYVSISYPKEKQNIGEVYQLLTASSEQDLKALFDVLPLTHPAKAPYNIFKQASEGVRGGVIIGLGSRLQVFQNRDIRSITAYNEIDLELPGKQPCAYYCITSDQDSTFDFLSSLFLSFVFIRLVRYADEHCPGGVLPVPVHVLGEELCACGVIPDLSRKISVIRSRNLSMSCVFQNLAGLQNRYPYNQWQEILGNCDVQLFLGCTDALTAEFISDRTGEVSISVTSKAKQLGTWRVSNYTPEYRLRGRVRHAEAGFLFQRTQFIKKRVIFGVCQRRRVQIVVFIPAAIQPVCQFPYSLLLALLHSLHQPFLGECSEVQFIDHLFDPCVIVPYDLHRRTVFRLYRDQTVPELQQQLRALGTNNCEVSQLFHFHMTPFIQQYRFPSTIPAVPQS